MSEKENNVEELKITIKKMQEKLKQKLKQKQDYRYVFVLNIITEELVDIEKSQNILDEWKRTNIIEIEKQTLFIMYTSADDIASKYLVTRINELNSHLLSNRTHEEYAKKLVKYVLDAADRAMQAHSYIWNNFLLNVMNKFL